MKVILLPQYQLPLLIPTQLQCQNHYRRLMNSRSLFSSISASRLQQQHQSKLVRTATAVKVDEMSLLQQRSLQKSSWDTTGSLDTQPLCYYRWSAVIIRYCLSAVPFFLPHQLYRMCRYTFGVVGDHLCPQLSPSRHLLSHNDKGDWQGHPSLRRPLGYRAVVGTERG